MQLPFSCFARLLATGIVLWLVYPLYVKFPFERLKTDTEPEMEKSCIEPRRGGSCCIDGSRTVVGRICASNPHRKQQDSIYQRSISLALIKLRNKHCGVPYNNSIWVPSLGCKFVIALWTLGMFSVCDKFFFASSNLI